MNFDSIASDIAATVVGGFLLAFAFFWIREKFFALPDVTGRWFFEIQTINSSYNPYKGMILRYMAILWRDGTRIHGTVEKIYEKSNSVELEYVGIKRTRGVVDGFLEKNYFSKDRMFLHVVEEGHGRQSTNSYELLILNTKEMNGTFVSMVADQEGKISCKRERF